MFTRSVVAPVLAASLVALAGRSDAGETPKAFNWLLPQDGSWFTPSAWDQGVAPGIGDAVGADVFIDAAGKPFQVFLLNFSGPDLPIHVGSLVLGERASMSLRDPASHESTARSLSLQDQSFFSLSRDFRVYESIDVAEQSTLNVANGRLALGGDLYNEGSLVITAINTTQIEGRSIYNSGVVHIFDLYDLQFKHIEVTDGFVNEGELSISADSNARIKGDMIHSGTIRFRNSSRLTIDGNLQIDEGATFIGVPTILLSGPPGSERRVTGELDLQQGALGIGDGGHWKIEDALTARTISTFGSPVDSIRVDSHLHAQILTLAATTIDLNSVTTHSMAQIVATDLAFHGDALFGRETVLNAQTLSFGGSYSFADDLTLNNAAVHFADGLHVGGNLTVTGTARVTVGEGTGINIDGSNITWTTPTVGLDHSLTAPNEIVLGVARINAPVTARRIVLGGTATELNADLFVTDNVSIAAASLSIGAVGEIAHHTFHGDMTTTYSFAQAWNFDILGSGARGEVESDTLTITGDAALYGFLRVNAIGGADALRAGDEFTLLTAALIQGSFRAMSLPSLSNGLYFDVVYEPSAVRLVVVPAPGAGVGLAVGVAGLAARRRRTHLAES